MTGLSVRAKLRLINDWAFKLLSSHPPPPPKNTQKSSKTATLLISVRHARETVRAKETEKKIGKNVSERVGGAEGADSCVLHSMRINYI